MCYKAPPNFCIHPPILLLFHMLSRPGLLVFEMIVFCSLAKLRVANSLRDLSFVPLPMLQFISFVMWAEHK